MKSILLTSTALVAFAGAAAADGHASVAFGGSATLGANTTAGVNTVETTALTWEVDLSTTATAALDNGLTASATFGLNIAENAVGTGVGNTAVTASGLVLKLASETASLSFGEIENVAEDNFGDVDGGTTIGFTEAVDDQAVLAGSVTMAGFTAQASMEANAANDALENVQVHIGGTFGSINVEAAFEDNTANADPVMGAAVSTTFAGATVTGSVVTDGTETSSGIAISYPFGPVTVGAFYSLNDVAEDNFGGDVAYAANGITVAADVEMNGTTDVMSWNVDTTYDVGNGIGVLAGANGTDATGANTTFYVAGTYDLGGGAAVLMSFADDGDVATVGEDLGDPEFNEGLTIEVSFAF
jgi:hypothetical protein